MLCDTIFTRRSVRKYDKTPLEESVLQDISEYLDDLESTGQLNEPKAGFEIVGTDKVRGPAPHYILAYCEKDDSAYVNVGYVLQKMDLYIQSKGLGSLYLGGKRPSNASNGFCIMMAFGKTDVPLRNGEQDFSRLPMAEISSDCSVAKYARVAPSARNTQPWKLTFEDNEVKVEYFGRGIFKGLLRKRLSMIDLGIVTRHVELGLLNEGKRISSIVTAPEPDNGFSVTFTIN
jgi:hypothetical protein